MKCFILLPTLILLIIALYGQSTICDPIGINPIGQILSELKSQGQSTFSLTVKKTSKKFIGYRICEHNYLQLDSLQIQIADFEIDTLLTCKNGTLIAVGFILFSRRHNTKDTVLQKLSEILRQDYIVMTSSCSDAINISNIGRYCFDLLIKPNFFFKPSFQLLKNEKIGLERDIEFYD